MWILLACCSNLTLAFIKAIVPFVHIVLSLRLIWVDQSPSKLQRSHNYLQNKSYCPMCYLILLHRSHLSKHVVMCSTWKPWSSVKYCFTIKCVYLAADWEKKKLSFVNSEILGLLIWGKKRVNYDKFEIATRQPK